MTKIVDMTDPDDSDTDPRADVAAAQREAAERHRTEHEPPPGSWRAKLREYEPETAVMYWDGKEWDVPAKLPNSYYEAVQAADARGMIQSVLGFEGMAELQLPRDIDAETVGLIAESIAEAVGKVWSVPNLNRSARRLQSTTRR